ncbi:sarcosine oxidase subunit beta, partial [Pseudomonas syringae pv. tagetis]
VCYRDDEIVELVAYAADPKALVLYLKIYIGKDLHERFVFLGPDVKGGSNAQHDGHDIPLLESPAFARAATRAWARIDERTE